MSVKYADGYAAAYVVHVLVKSKYINSFALCTWLHQWLHYLQFSFLLVSVRNIHHRSFCISVHCEVRQRGRSRK